MIELDPNAAIEDTKRYLRKVEGEYVWSPHLINMASHLLALVDVLPHALDCTDQYCPKCEAARKLIPTERIDDASE